MANYFQQLSIILIFVTASFAANQATAQCETWVGADRSTDAQDQHVLYREALKLDDYDKAFTHWQQAYELAPAADGKRDWHYLDGVDIYLEKIKKETDEAKKKEYADIILKLYQEAIACHEQGAIDIKGVTSEERIAYIYGRMGYNMYYYLRTVYSKTMETMAKAVELGGDNTEYIVLHPYALVTVYQYSKDKVSAEQAREVHTLINKIGEKNVAENKDYGTYYRQALDAANAEFAKIEHEIFDCNYFKDKFKPEFEADRKNADLAKTMYAKLVQQGCPEDDPFVERLGGIWKVYADSVNAVRQAEFEANNPGFVARKLFDDGDYAGAIAKYEEAIEKETDDSKKAEYYFGIASIRFRKLNQYSSARAMALKAASLKDNWGRPYMLIGDMYVKSAASCGSDGYSRGLAIIAAVNKYSYAKSIDAEVADEANSRIGRYRSSFPTQEDVFMRGMDGKKDKVPCWIGETVTVQYN